MIDTKEKSLRLGDFLREEDVHLGVSGATQLVESADEFFRLLADAGV